MVPVATALIEAGADGVCVATLDEALVLRRAGIDRRITVLFPIPPATGPEAASAGVDVAVGDGEHLHELFAALAAARHPDGRAPRLAVQLEIETGLGRGGVAPAEVVAAAGAIVDSGDAVLGGVWTHFQATENPELTAAQVGRFDAALSALAEAGIAVPRRHVAASGGILVEGVPRYDVVRPGLMTYGIVPDELTAAMLPQFAARLQPVLSLRARPIRVADLAEHHGVSYGPTFVTRRPSRIATLPLGYGDGWPRSVSNRAEALVRGVRVPLVGNVAMDAVMADVTDVPGDPVGLADELVLIGSQGDDRITVPELAQARTTNSWEVVTTMSRRLPRVYHAAAGPVGVRLLGDAEDGWRTSSSGTATSAISRSTRS